MKLVCGLGLPSIYLAYMELSIFQFFHPEGSVGFHNCPEFNMALASSLGL
jgi:hypothetical protein